MQVPLINNSRNLQTLLIQFLLSIFLMGMLMYPSAWLIYSGVNDYLAFNQITSTHSNQNYQSYYSSETKNTPACLTNEVSVPTATDVRSESNFSKSKTISGIIFCATKRFSSMVWLITKITSNSPTNQSDKDIYIKISTFRL